MAGWGQALGDPFHLVPFPLHSPCREPAPVPCPGNIFKRENYIGIKAGLIYSTGSSGAGAGSTAHFPPLPSFPPSLQHIFLWHQVLQMHMEGQATSVVVAPSWGYQAAVLGRPLAPYGISGCCVFLGSPLRMSPQLCSMAKESRRWEAPEQRASHPGQPCPI